MKLAGGIVAIFTITACISSVMGQGLFESHPTRKTGVRFQNDLKEDKLNNILRYEYFYNGGGVAVVGDINNDGLDDIYFTGNMVPNRLYLNQVDFKFKDIGKEAGVSGKKTWTTGVTMVDIIGEGLRKATRGFFETPLYGMRSKFTTYESFADAKLTDMLTKEQLQNAQELKVTTLNTLYLENNKGKLIPHDLPKEASIAPIYAISVMDYTGDGNLDFILGGNQNATRLGLGLIYANFGQVYAGGGRGDFRYIAQKASGLRILGDVKSMLPIKLAHLDVLLVGVNKQGVDSYFVELLEDS